MPRFSTCPLVRPSGCTLRLFWTDDVMRPTAAAIWRQADSDADADSHVLMQRCFADASLTLCRSFYAGNSEMLREALL